MPVSAVTASRRDFMRWSLALGAAAALPGNGFAATPTFDQLALLSDVHVSDGIFGSMRKRLSAAVEQILALPQQPGPIRRRRREDHEPLRLQRRLSHLDHPQLSERGRPHGSLPRGGGAAG